MRRRLSSTLKKFKKENFSKKNKKKKDNVHQPDSWIKNMQEHNMIEPFLDHQVSEKYLMV